MLEFSTLVLRPPSPVKPTMHCFCHYNVTIAVCVDGGMAGNEELYCMHYVHGVTVCVSLA